jgi:hypothetical protein
MDFKINFYLIIIFVWLLSSCSNKNDVNSLNDNSASLNKCEKLDSFILSSARIDYIFVGKRIYPSFCENDSILMNNILKENIYSVIEKGDSLFVFVNSNMFDYENNQYLPNLTDSNLFLFYKSYYKMTIEAGVPYFIYFKSNLDDIMLEKIGKPGNEKIVWFKALIRDTLFSISPNIKVGLNKETFFNKIELQRFNYSKKDFTVILMGVYDPSYIWYYNFIKDSIDFNKDSGWFIFLFNFENNIITSIEIPSGRCYYLKPTFVRRRW